MSTRYTAAEVARILNLSGSAFKSCLRAAGFPLPTRRQPLHCTFQDLILLKTTKNLLAAKIPVSRIHRILESLKRQLPEDQQIWNLTIYADGQRVVVWDGTAHWQPDSGQFLFNFEPKAVAKEITLPRSAKKARLSGRTAKQWIETALELEAHSPEEARQAYREAIKLEPDRADAHINLGRLYHEAQEWSHAEASYRAAIEHAPDGILAHFNLAVLLQSRGQHTAAIEAYREVLARDAGFYEAHYNLGLLYESDNRKLEAIRHFSAAQKLLKPQGQRRVRGRNRPEKGPFPPHHSAS